MSRVKSDVFYHGITTGHAARYLHTNSTVTIKGEKGTPFVLLRIVINTTSSTAITITDAENNSIVATLKASIAENNYEYHVPLNPNFSGAGMTISNAGGSDLTVIFSNN